MLQRVAMHQTRLRVPGLGIDGKGVVLGSRGLVVLASIERLVAFLSLYTSERSLADSLSSTRIELVRSKMNTREVLLSLPVVSSEFLDHVAEVARLALGHCFTGSSKHFVQFRDASAPFGYDVSEVLPSDADYVLYHSMYTQTYARDKDIDLPRLLLRLRPHLDPSTARDLGELWIAAEEGVGPAFIQYLIRSRVEARVGLAEWPPATSLDDAPVRRYLFAVPALPDRMVSLVRTTPGLAAFRLVCPGVAVQLGFRHPVNLMACPVFPHAGLVMFRGGAEPLLLPELPALGDIMSFARVSFHQDDSMEKARVLQALQVPPVAVPVRLAPSLESFRQVRASFLSPPDYPLLRRLLYALGTRTLREAKIAFSNEGAMLVHPSGAESIPVGIFLRELREGLFVAAGYEPVPAIDADVVHRTLGSPQGVHVVMLPGRAPFGFRTESFVSLQDALIDAGSWAPVDVVEIESAMDAPIPQVQFERLGMRPLAGLEAPAAEEPDGKG